MTDPTSKPIPTTPRGRIAAIVVARGVALIAMAIYHLAWDLEFFGYAERGLTAAGGWKIFARSIASSFLFLVGVSLFLAHRNGVRWPGFWRRWAMVVAAALAISIGTWFASRETFIFFGILHQIALASLLGLLFLRLPALAILAIAAFVIATPFVFRADLFNHPALWWVGLSSVNPRSNDYVPLFPWFGAVLIGIAAAKLGSAAGIFEQMRQWRLGRWSQPLTFIGRHSLAFYLIHQPVLIGLVWLFSQVVPPQLETRQVQFRQSCEATCTQARDEEFCARYCVCMLERLESGGNLDAVMNAGPTDNLDDVLRAPIAQCTAESEPGAQELEGTPE